MTHDSMTHASSTRLSHAFASGLRIYEQSATVEFLVTGAQSDKAVSSDSSKGSGQIVRSVSVVGYGNSEMQRGLSLRRGSGSV